MKRVSFKTAKALKEVGFPQGVLPQILKDKSFPMYYNGDYVPNYVYFYAYFETTFDPNLCVACPTYIEVWLWLWREKNIQFSVNGICDYRKQFMYVGCDCGTLQLGGITTEEFNDPEEAIIAAIEYLVENGLIK